MAYTCVHDENEPMTNRFREKFYIKNFHERKQKITFCVNNFLKNAMVIIYTAGIMMFISEKLILELY